MNLMHLLTKKDRNLVVDDGVKPFKRVMANRMFTGLELPPGAAFRVKTALRWYPLNTFPSSAGWLAFCAQKGSLNIAFEAADGKTHAAREVEVTKYPGPLPFPQFGLLQDHVRTHSLDLVVRNTSKQKGSVHVLISETIPPEPLYARAVGRGVEIGPGPSPRILAAPGREVFYLERETMEDFERKYNTTGNFPSMNLPETRAFWAKVIQGRAHNIPVEDHSLGFIFSSDVFEHLVNPLGHLEYWRSKLQINGRVLAIVPHISGCSDYKARPSKFAYWLQQFEKGDFVERVDHHQPYAAARALSAQTLFETQFSSHFSFFTTENLSEMLDFAVTELGYSGYDIQYGVNSKKIYFSLYARKPRPEA